MLPSRSYRRADGQAIIVVAVALPFIIALLFTGVEIGSRMLQRQQVEDALRQATRSAVQTFDYRMFAQNKQGLLAPSDVEGVARTVFTTNLQGIRGLQQDPAATAALVKWTVLPLGGADAACGDATFTTPVVCASLDLPMQPLVPFMSSWTPRITAVEVLDRIEP